MRSILIGFILFDPCFRFQALRMCDYTVVRGNQVHT